MTRHRLTHLGIQCLRHASQALVLLLVIAVVYLSLYAHYRASRALEDDQFLSGPHGAVLKQIDKHVSTMDDPDAQKFLDGYKGTVWSMRIAGVDLADPLAAAEMTAASWTIHWPLVASIAIPVLVTLVLGRVFCSWMCPAGLLFELTDKVRGLLRLAEIKPAEVRFSHRNKYAVLLVGLVVAAITGLPLFALVYPPAVMSRVVHAWVFGTAVAGMLLLLGTIVALEVFVSRRWWCRTVCPGGALYGLLGWPRLLRVKLKRPLCTGCRDCEPVCPMGLYPVLQSSTIECDNCAACLGHCPTKALYVTVGMPGRRRGRWAWGVGRGARSEGRRPKAEGRGARGEPDRAKTPSSRSLPALAGRFCSPPCSGPRPPPRTTSWACPTTPTRRTTRRPRPWNTPRRPGPTACS